MLDMPAELMSCMYYLEWYVHHEWNARLDWMIMDEGPNRGATLVRMTMPYPINDEYELILGATDEALEGRDPKEASLEMLSVLRQQVSDRAAEPDSLLLTDEADGP